MSVPPNTLAQSFTSPATSLVLASKPLVRAIVRTWLAILDLATITSGSALNGHYVFWRRVLMLPGLVVRFLNPGVDRSVPVASTYDIVTEAKGSDS